ncbi:heparanase-like protein 2 [Capsicum galapagoense]
MDSRILRLFCLVFLVSSCFINLSNADELKLMVKGVTSIAQSDDNFICATLDWWPENKCDYNQCPWGKAGLLNLDLKNKILANAVKAFKPLRIRIGGSLQDQVYYKVGKYPKQCSNFEKKSDGLFGFGDGCLHMNRWDELNDLFNQTGAAITFSFNALLGRIPSDEHNTLWEGDWNQFNAKSLMKYTIEKGYKIDSYELGNELCGGGVAARIKPHQYGKDVKKLKRLVTHMYPNPADRPKILAPGGFYDEKWFQEFLLATGPGVVDGLTHHIYNLGAGVDPTLLDKLQNPFFLSQVAQAFKNVENDAKLFSPSSGPWVGEAGGAYNSGGKHTSHTFVNGFWYLDQLGMTSTFNHKVYCRQSLIGGNYGLLNTTSFIPNPDYYGALLWHKLMGKNVLSATHEGSPYIRTYAHCSKTSGITVLLINMDKSTTFDVSAVDDLNIHPVVYPESVESIHQREEYHLTPKDGNIQSDVLLLNGTPLKLTSSLDIPEMNPKLVDPTFPISVAPQSIVFATLRGFQAPACA